jgi:hypothetical protein
MAAAESKQHMKRVFSALTCELHKKVFPLFTIFLLPFPDDTYMYDDSITASNYRNIHPHHQHWYDEPPYESDPDDFLMAGLGPVASIQVREHKTLF